MRKRLVGIAFAGALAGSILAGGTVAAGSPCGSGHEFNEDGHGIGWYVSSLPHPRDYSGDENATKGTDWPGVAGYCSPNDNWSKSNATGV